MASTDQPLWLRREPLTRRGADAVLAGVFEDVSASQAAAAFYRSLAPEFQLTENGYETQDEVRP